ncbi:hypothetical protein [Dyadobacter sp. 676]|uniref:DNA primase n=1 Tax=Dyadobacter sp. 676 TaxID=3088362 RepID=A0AAU8FGR5_9BACT
MIRESGELAFADISEALLEPAVFPDYQGSTKKTRTVAQKDPYGDDDDDDEDDFDEDLDDEKVIDEFDDDIDDREVVIEDGDELLRRLDDFDDDDDDF